MAVSRQNETADRYHILAVAQGYNSGKHVNRQKRRQTMARVLGLIALFATPYPDAHQPCLRVCVGADSNVCRLPTPAPDGPSSSIPPKVHQYPCQNYLPTTQSILTPISKSSSHSDATEHIQLKEPSTLPQVHHIHCFFLNVT